MKIVFGYVLSIMLIGIGAGLLFIEYSDVVYSHHKVPTYYNVVELVETYQVDDIDNIYVGDSRDIYTKINNELSDGEFKFSVVFNEQIMTLSIRDDNRTIQVNDQFSYFSLGEWFGIASQDLRNREINSYKTLAVGYIQIEVNENTEQLVKDLFGGIRGVFYDGDPIENAQ